MTSTTLGLRERKKLKTRLAIEAAAIELFDRKGFDETTVEEIADAVEISPRTFFRYFPSKEHVVFAHSDLILSRLLEAVEAQAVNARPVDAIRESLVLMAEGIEAHHADNLARSRLMSRYPALGALALQLDAQWEEAIAARLAARAGKRKADLAMRAVAACAMSANRLAVNAWRASGGRASLTRLLGDAFDAIAGEFCGRASKTTATGAADGRRQSRR